MRFKIVSLVSFALVIGCGTPFKDVVNMGKRSYNKSKTDELFRPYINNFIKQFDISVKVPVTLRKLDANKAGVCLIWSDGYREVQINSTHWQFFTEEQKEQLVFHELGHCVFNLGHDDSLMPSNDNCPNSIMRSSMFSRFEASNCYAPERIHYMENIDARR